MEKRELSPGKGVVRTGETVRRPVRPWSGSVCRFQRFMEAGGLPVEAVVEMTGSAVVTAFCEGETNHPRGWSDEALPDAKKRAEQVRIVCDGYGLVAAQRRRLPEQIVETVICETAHEAIDPGVSTGDAGPLWGFAWRTRSLYWIWRHRALLRRALD